MQKNNYCFSYKFKPTSIVYNTYFLIMLSSKDDFTLPRAAAIQNQLLLQHICTKPNLIHYERQIPPVLPGGRGHRQITQNRPYKKIICG